MFSYGCNCAEYEKTPATTIDARQRTLGNTGRIDGQVDGESDEKGEYNMNTIYPHLTSLQDV